MALLRSAESAANPGDHSVIQGAAPAGATLRLKKSFTTDSSPICTFAQGLLVAGGPLAPLDCVAPGASTSTPDKLDYTMVVPSSGQYEWHVTPSTRPFVAHKVTPGGYSDASYKEEKFEPQTGDIPAGDRGIDDPQGLNGSEEQPYAAERQFTLAPEEAGNKVQVDLNWDVPAQDFDLRLYHRADNGTLEPAGTGTGPTGGSAGGSGEANGVPEQVVVERAQPGEYVARVIYYMTGAPQTGQGNDWHMSVTRYQLQPDKVESGKEYWTMSCESGGQTLESKDIYVERGQAVTADFACGQAAPSAAAPQGGVLGTRVVSPPRKKVTSKRAACIQKASKIKPRSKRRAAVRRCKKRYPTAAERRAAARKRAAARRR
jgi:hypothetical protein